MGTRADELKAEIANTRADLTGTMNEMGERVSPGRIVARRTDKVRQTVTGWRESIMGAADHVGSAGGALPAQAGGVVGAAVDAARQAPQNLAGTAQGSPLAAGLIAFGAGLLAASVLPASDAEQRAVSQVLDQAQPAIDQARDAAHELVGDLKDSVAGAAEQVKTTASDAVGSVTDQATSAAGEVASTASDAAADVKDQARDSAATVKERAQG